MSNRGFTIWFIVCAVIALAGLIGVAVAMIILFPRLIALMDRLG